MVKGEKVFWTFRETPSRQFSKRAFKRFRSYNAARRFAGKNKVYKNLENHYFVKIKRKK